jgi:hypothetical protein|tara:strand:+ start:1163 stop:1321 length:159 start_codon:yes stop_codon:yes gene_type:complete
MRVIIKIYLGQEEVGAVQIEDTETLAELRNIADDLVGAGTWNRIEVVDLFAE